MSAGVGLELMLDAPSAAAGEILSGRAPGGAAEVQLVRRERTPGAHGSFHCSVALPDAGGRFEIEVPGDAPPTTATDRCQLGYSLIARRPGSRRSRAAVAHDVIVTAGPVPVHVDAHPRDRMIASFDARRFHIELAEVDLRGGGRMSGRVHTRRPDPPAGVVVYARLLEWWRIDRGWNVNHQPMWRDAVLWESEPRSAVWRDRETWVGFEFDLPPGLPPAVEGRVLAWRYEVEARRSIRFALDQRAVLTPTGFQAL
jgi:hypothetical protein